MADAHPEKRTDFLTARQLAEYLQVSESTVRRLRRSGRIPAIQLTDRLVRFNLKDVRTALLRASARNRPPGHEDLDGDSAQMEFADVLAGFEAGE
jgi:excisionase family DNA binding protein